MLLITFFLRVLMHYAGDTLVRVNCYQRVKHLPDQTSGFFLDGTANYLFINSVGCLLAQ